MANTYKNIVITPNRSSNTADPKVVYSGGNTTANTDITLNVYPDSNGTLSWEGSAGQLFSITNDLSNNLFGVNDVSGIPSLEVYANGLVSIAPISGNVGVRNTAPSHTMSINGDLLVNTDIDIGNSSVNAVINSTAFFTGNVTTGTGGLLANTTRIFVGNNTINAAVNTTTLSIGGTLIANSTGPYGKTEGNLNVNSATQATNATNLNSQPGSFYTNATNITTGTLPYAQIPANIINTTAAFTISGIHTYNANIVLGSSGLSANGSFGTAGQVLHSNGTATYWSVDDNAGGTVTSVSGTGTVSGLTLSGTVTTTGSLTLGGTLSASVIDNMTDEHRLFNNMGDNHTTRTAFDASSPSYNFGWRFVQGNTNGPNINSATQYYSEYVGLGNDYPATGAGSYGMYIAYPRNVTTPYIAIRYNEGNALGAWQKISAGFADTANNASFLGGTAAASYQLNSTLSANVATLTANNATYFGGYTWAAPAILGGTTANGASLTYANVSGQVNTATLYATTSANIASVVQANSLGIHVGGNNFINTTALDIGNTVITSVLTTLGGQINANGSVGTAGQVLTSGAAGNVYWSTPQVGDITAVTAGNGLTGGGTSGDVTLDVGAANGITVAADTVGVLANSGLLANTTGVHVLANTGIVANSTGTFVNATYIGTLSANNASFLGGTAAASYQLNSTLNANIASYLPTYTGVVNGSSHTVGTSFTANSTVVNAVSYYAGTTLIGNTTGPYGKTEGNLNVNNATTAYSKTEGNLNVNSALTANNSTNLGGTAAASYQLNSTLNANIASYLPTYTGVVNGSSYTVGTSFTANATGVYHTGTVNAASHTVGTSFVANTIQVTISGIPLSANGSTGSSGQVLTSNGATGAPYWAAAAAGVNTAAQYVWTNTHTFNSNVTVGNSSFANTFLNSSTGISNPQSLTAGVLQTNASLNTLLVGPYTVSSGNSLIVTSGSRLVII